MLRDNLVGLIEPMPTARENDGSSLALSIHKQRQASDDRSSCLKNPRPAGAESSLTERTTSPFQTEPRHLGVSFILIWTPYRKTFPKTVYFRTLRTAVIANDHTS